MKRIIVAACISLGVCSFLFSADGGKVKISVIDFAVSSKNPDYEFLGKGFAEFVSVELSSSRDVLLVERQKLQQIINEQKLSLTGLIDENHRVEVGKLISADYFIFGSIFDIAGKMSLVYRVIETSTGKVILEEKLTEDISKYDYISAVVAKKVLSGLKAYTPDELTAKAENPVNKSGEVAVKFSKAVNAYDKGDFISAKAQLKEAKKLDPANKAIEVYSAKLNVNNCKFKTLSERHFPVKNPAFLGFAKNDSYYLSFSGMSEDPNVYSADGIMGIQEYDGRTKTGFTLPIGTNFGAGVEYNAQGIYKDVLFHNTGTSSVPVWVRQAEFDAELSEFILSLGFKLNNNLSIGIAGSSYNQNLQLAVNGQPRAFSRSDVNCYCAQLGLVYKDNGENLVLDAFVGYSTERLYSYSAAGDSFSPYRIPVVEENTMTLANKDKTLYFVLKQSNQIYTDVQRYTGKLLPAVEYWPVDFLALRGGVELAYYQQNSTSSFQTGYLTGATVTIPGINLDIDINFSFWKRPSRTLENLYLNETIINWSFNFNHILF
ncbi:MAG: hypothetical protein A2231_12615 [Candidatus Firestonebacteria bacterium RIFOXYA2_FULL_40_8]|nr:MAG: hypothetical protein A2231_12615 [Candidatus Firestonebacteria bacterium RIFOXYA2_FULL_40_8]